MKRSLNAFIIAILCASFCSAQTAVTTTIPVSDTIQTGFVVITPLSGTGQGLSVSETFGERSGAALFQSSVLTSPLITLTSVVANTNPFAGVNTGVAIVNPNSSAVAVTLTLGNQQGATVATRTITVGAHQQISRFVTELFAGEAVVAAPMTGLLLINSTSPVAVMGLSFNGLSFTSLPVAAQLTTFTAGSGQIGTFSTIPGTSVVTQPTVVVTPSSFGTLTPSPIPTTITQIPSTFAGLTTPASVAGLTTVPPPTPVTGPIAITGSGTSIITSVPVVTTSPIAGATVVVGTTGSTIFTNQISTGVPTATTVLTPNVFIIPQMTSGVGGPGALLLPQVATGGGWVSQITIANTSGVTQAVRVDFFDAFGNPMVLPFGASVPSIVINSGGVSSFSTISTTVF
jgi:hypothetical protein